MARRPSRPSSIDRLLPDLQELIAKLRREGLTIDEIRAKLLELDVEVSRSALGRHLRYLDARIEMAKTLAMAFDMALGSMTQDEGQSVDRAVAMLLGQKEDAA